MINSSSNKINDLFYLINDEYVDSVSIPDLVEKSLPTILQNLDPHSVYISANEVESSMQELNGSFSGIGVQFTIYRDTVRIVSIIKGGPSESVGLKAGDKIVAIDGKPFVGDSLSNDMVMKRLKGTKGSNVKVDILRNGSRQPISYNISRGDVPISSIRAAYKITDDTGYIRISTFGSNTLTEFWSAMAKFNMQGLKSLILDLRGNPGGYMEPAVQIANEFLAKNKLIVYTEGYKAPREEQRSDGRGAYQNLPLVVLVDESSASASEILSGALQDNDRATIVGRRTFGKGLVQVPIEFKDGSMIRLTRSRYYTPAGRCVQKPYKAGQDDEYQADLLLREESGEYYNEDSIHVHGEKYYTSIGRVVYGGGGIIPDVFTPADTIGMNSYFREAYIGGHIFQFAYNFTDTHRNELEAFTQEPMIASYLEQKNLPEIFAQFAESNGLKRRNLMLKKSEKLFRQQITANIINDVLGEQAAQIYLNQNDVMIQRALQIIAEGKAFPEANTKVALRNQTKGDAIRQPYTFVHYAYAPPMPLLKHFAICTTRKNKPYAKA